MNKNNNDFDDYMTESENLLSPILCYDCAFYEVFDGLDDVLLRMFTDITGTSYETLKNEIVFLKNDEKIDEYDHKNLDKKFILRRLDSHILFLELNESAAYGKLTDAFSRMYKVYIDDKGAGLCSSENILIHLDFNIYKDMAYNKSDELEISYMQDANRNRLYLKRKPLYHVIVPKCYETYCNNKDKELDKLIYWGAMFYCTDSAELVEILDKIVTPEEKDIIIERFNNFNRDKLHLNSAENYNIYQKRKADATLKTMMKTCKEMEEISNEKEGENDNFIKEIVLNLHMKEMPINDICDVVSLSEEEVNDIINNQ